MIFNYSYIKSIGNNKREIKELMIKKIVIFETIFHKKKKVGGSSNSAESELK